LYMLAFYSMCERSRDLTPPPEVAVNSSLRHVLRRLLSLLPWKWAETVLAPRVTSSSLTPPPEVGG
jgi:hypothetical protein